MKNKLKTFGRVILSMVGMILLFIIMVGIGNYFQRNGLYSKHYGFGFKGFIANFFLGIGLALAVSSLVLLIAKVFIGIDFEFSGLKNDFQEPLMSLLTTLLIVGVWEEFYFRGLVFNTFLKSNFSFHLSAIISSLLFSVIHWSSFDMAETSIFWYLGVVFIGYILIYLCLYKLHMVCSFFSFHLEFYCNIDGWY